MSSVRSFTVDLPEDLARFLDAKVASGDYESGQALVVGLLRDWVTEAESDAEWLRSEIEPALAQLDADPGSAVPLAEAFERLRSRRKNFA